MDGLEWEKTLPKKRMATGVFIFNGKGELLLVKPTYKNHWVFPGGVVDKDESPGQAGIREVKEEIGLDLPGLDFVCVNYMKTGPEKTESLQFIFNAGKIPDDTIKKIKLDPKEISEYRFYKIKKALPLMTSTSAYRLQKSLKAIKNNQAIYLE